MKNQKQKKPLQKTNAMRILDKAGIDYQVYEYECNGFLEGENVAKELGEDMAHVFKTIVTIANTRDHYVVMLPVDKEIDFKRVAKVFGVKSVEMIPVTTLTSVTGYVRGGCSPVGMKKQFKTVIDDSLDRSDKVIFSGGRLGLQMETNVGELIDLLDAKYEHITMN